MHIGKHESNENLLTQAYLTQAQLISEKYSATITMCHDNHRSQTPLNGHTY